MSHSEKCPVCGGRGQIIDNDFTMTAYARPCHGCDGRGWVTVRDETDGNRQPVMATRFGAVTDEDARQWRELMGGVRRARPVDDMSDVPKLNGPIYKNGESCGHPGCLNHVTHPCEKCGRLGGKTAIGV